PTCNKKNSGVARTPANAPSRITLSRRCRVMTDQEEAEPDGWLRARKMTKRPPVRVRMPKLLNTLLSTMARSQGPTPAISDAGDRRRYRGYGNRRDYDHHPDSCCCGP